MNPRRFRWMTILIAVFFLAACTASPTPTATQPATDSPATEAEPSPVVEITTQASPAPATPPASVEPASSPTAVQAAAMPDGSKFAWKKLPVELASPVNLSSSPDETGRLFVLEKVGRIRVVQQDALQPEPYLDLSDRVGSSASEQGLLGLAFAPDFAQSGLFYVNYTNKAGQTVIAQFAAQPAASAQADPASEKILLTIDQPAGNHNGGHIEFGPDGYLYVGMGDGGGAGDPNNNAQNPQSLLGKLLRLEVKGDGSYQSPADNPYPQAEVPAEIAAMGLRNPWKFTFDTQTNALIIADVGQQKWEEINIVQLPIPAVGYNFGWRLYEGNHPYQSGSQPMGSEFVAPVYEYDHGKGCSITGGSITWNAKQAAFNGVYLFGDFCSGIIWGLVQGADGAVEVKEIFESGNRIAAFHADQQGEIYLVDISSGLYRLESK